MANSKGKYDNLLPDCIIRLNALVNNSLGVQNLPLICLKQWNYLQAVPQTIFSRPNIQPNTNQPTNRTVTCKGKIQKALFPSQLLPGDTEHENLPALVQCGGVPVILYLSGDLVIACQ